MKKIFLTAIAFATLFVSCTTNNDSLASLGTVPTETATAITAFVANNYPDTKVISSVPANSAVTTELNTGEVLKFSSAGTYIAYSNNASLGLTADSLGLTATTTDSISGKGHKGGKHGDKGGKGGKGGKDSGTKGHDGGKGGKGGKHGHDRHFENEISIDSLGTQINAYISTNYAGYTVLHAEKDTLCEGVVTEVLVSLSSAQPVKLVFDSYNVYLFKAQRIEYATVPTAVSAAVTANYSAYTVMRRSEIYTLADGTLKYNVYLKSADTKKNVTFTTDGAVSCEK